MPPTGTGQALDEVIDRIAATLPWPAGELPLHEQDRVDQPDGHAVCNRMTLFYGREWRHENLEEATHARLSELVGPGGLEVFRHLFFIALRKRLTDRDGENVYLKQHLARKNWTFHTLFAHGSDNQVFDVRSAVQSWKRMTMVHAVGSGPADPALRLFIPEGRYGHMDFLFGKDAARDVYPRLTEFLAAPEAFSSRVQGTAIDPRDDPVIVVNRGTDDEQDITDRVSGISRAPVCGPMLRVELQGGVRRLVLWCEQAVDATSNFQPPALRIDGQVRTLDEDYSCERSAPAGAGVCWLIVVPESASIVFERITRIELLLRYEGAIPMVSYQDLPPSWKKDLREGLKHGWFHKSYNFGAKWSFGLIKPLQFVPQDAATAAASPPMPEEGWHAVEITALPWWKRWSQAQAAPPATTAFLAVSCRWPGLPFERDAVHRIAGPMLAHVEPKSGEPVHGLVLLGDQIYVDATANVTETTEPGERGAQRYRDAWDPDSAAGRLLAKLPTWMVVDDHEFGDDLGEYETSQQDSDELTKGFDATLAFQWRSDQGKPSRWPGGTRPPSGRGPAARGFWYAFEIGGLPAFAADTRTERQSRADPAGWTRAEIMGAEQAAALEQWLLAHRDEPKILCSGSVFALPTARCLAHPPLRRHADDWCGYPASMERMVAFLVRNRIRNLVFLSGDYHLSAVASLRLAHGGQQVDALSIVASGWNASLPFANAQEHEFAWDRPSDLACGAGLVTSTPRLLSDQPRQFSKVAVTRGTAGGCEVRVEVFGPDGKPLKDDRRSLG